MISVENLVIKYAPELPPVLHGVSFQLKARERVGLLGRTGSGKSTLATSILRFVSLKCAIHSRMYSVDDGRRLSLPADASCLTALTSPRLGYTIYDPA